MIAPAPVLVLPQPQLPVRPQVPDFEQEIVLPNVPDIDDPTAPPAPACPTTAYHHKMGMPWAWLFSISASGCIITVPFVGNHVSSKPDTGVKGDLNFVRTTWREFLIVPGLTDCMQLRSLIKRNLCFVNEPIFYID